VASVAAQTRRPAEVIVVEDGSADETLGALETVQQKYGEDWIKIIILPENQGPGSARNAGWAVATQPYIAFLDADDAWHPRKIEIQLGWMREHPEVALTGHACRVVAGQSGEQLDVEVVSGYASFKQVGRWRLLVSNHFPTRSVILKRELSYRFVPGKRHSEDYLLWNEICLDGHACYWSPLPLAFLFKAHYGGAGLSGSLWLVEKGELNCYTRLYESNRIGRPALMLLQGLSLAKYVKRLMMVSIVTGKQKGDEY
jgi:glycosyltransferase involved in cell wall biosynthesis